MVRDWEWKWEEGGQKERGREEERKGMRLKLLEGPPSVVKHELHVYINNVYKLIKYKNYKLINKILARQV